MLSIEVYMIAIYFLSPIRSAQVFEGHPFIVEAGVSLGGKDVKQVRCPLLGSDCSTAHIL